MSIFDDFLVRAVLGALGVALAAAPLGCFLVWRRMAYFGDATAHASLLGVAVALGFGISIFWGALAMAGVMAILVVALSGRLHNQDALLGVLAHSALATGLVMISLVPNVRVDLGSYLFGDILSISKTDLILIWVGAALVSGLLIWRWGALLIATLSPDLAFAKGINPKHEELALVLALALVVAIALKIVGALLIVALLIIPASAARFLAKSPPQMAVIAAIIGSVAALAGLYGSARWDTPAGASIVVAAAIVFWGLSVFSLRRA